MMNSEREPSHSDAIELKRLFEEAVEAMNGSNCELPDYAESVNTLMQYITSSPWRNGQYPAGKMTEIFNQIDTSSMQDVRSMLTAIARSERFSTGAWKSTFESGRLDEVVKRAETICAS